MKIAVDCRYLGRSGIGRVCEGIIDHLDYSLHTFYLIGKPEQLEKYSGAVIIEDYTDPYSSAGLFRFNKNRVNRECDSIVIPNFLIPFGIKIPVHTVMHDLIFLDVKETVNGKADYAVKKYLLKRCMAKSKSVACVSGFTESRCAYHFKKYAGKCYVCYNGLSRNIIEYAARGIAVEKENTVVFVGNVKRHKGLITLLYAFAQLQGSGMTLKIIGEREGFLTGLDLDENAYQNVVFTGRISDEELYREIAKAKYLVQPSVYEGFGIPPIEAMYLGTQPIISDIAVFKELYHDMPVVFFSDAADLKEKLLAEPKSFDVKEKILQKFNFEKFAAALTKRVTQKG